MLAASDAGMVTFSVRGQHVACAVHAKGKTALEIAVEIADVGARLVVGTRRRDEGGDLLGTLGGAIKIVDLDIGECFERSDLVGYAMATLQLLGSERPDNPYTPPK